MQMMKKTVLIFLACLVWAVFSTGCVSIPVGQYEALRDSSKQLYANTTETYSRIEKFQRYFSVVTAPNATINADAFKPIVDGKSYDLSPELRFRETAFEVVVNYTVYLAALSSKDYQSDVDKASQELAGSLKNLAETTDYPQDSAKALGITASFFDIIGKQVIEHERINALRESMDKAQENVTNLSNLITGSNEKIKKAVLEGRETVITHANAVRPAYGTASRIEFDTGIADTLVEIEEIIMSLDIINKGVTRLPEAHQEIRALLDKKETSGEALREIIQEAQRANKLYRDLSK